MAIELTQLLQHANAVGSDQASHVQIFVNTQGDISGKSGLSFFKRHFSSSAREQENRATLEFFRQSLQNDPKYSMQLQTKQVDRFFQTKHAQGTPLTAQDVQHVNLMLALENAEKVGGELVDLTIIPKFDAAGFAWFCVGNGLESLGSPEKTMDALKAYYEGSYCDAVAEQVLTKVGVEPQNIQAALAVLKASSAWSQAMKSSFDGDLNDLTHTGILQDFSDALKDAAGLLRDMSKKPGVDSSFLQNMALDEKSKDMAAFNAALEAMRTGAITTEEASLFVDFCNEKDYALSTPELLKVAVGTFCIHRDSEEVFIRLATEKGFPAGVGKALAHNPEFRALVNSVLSKDFTPQAPPTREQIDTVINTTAATFLADKSEAIRALLDLAGKSGDFEPALGALAGTLDEKLICDMLNPLLSGQALLDHLLDPEKGPDHNLITLLENFGAAVESCQHFVKEGDDVCKKALAVLLGARGADEETLYELLEQVSKNFLTIGPGLASMHAGVLSGTIKCGDISAVTSGIRHAQNIMRKVADFAYSTTSTLQKEALGISEDIDVFCASLESAPDGNPLPINAMHQSVRAFGETHGVRIAQLGYKESDTLASSEAIAFTGSSEKPAVTNLLRERAGAIMREIGLAHFTVDSLDLQLLGTHIYRAVLEKNQELLSPAQARALAEQALREYLLELKPAMDFIAGLPTESSEPFAVTPAEKERLLRVIPGTPLRDPELIKAVLLESRNLREPLQKLLTPGLSRDDMATPLLQISSTHIAMTGSFKAHDKVTGEVSGAYQAALTLALDALQPSRGQEMALFELVSGAEGMQLGRSFVHVAQLCETSQQPNIHQKKYGLLAGMSALNTLRMLLGQRTGVAVEDEPLLYTEEMSIQDIPGSVFVAAADALNLKSTDIPGYAALSLVTPKLTEEQWRTLMLVIQMVGKGFTAPHDHDFSMKMVAAYARELLEAAEKNRGKPLSPAQIWQTVIGDKAPADITADNLGARMYETAASRLFQRAWGVPSTFDADTLKKLAQHALSKGIPFQTLLKAYQAGGTLGLTDSRFGAPHVASLPTYTMDNAYGLVTDWGRRKPDAKGNPSVMTIYTNDGQGFLIAHKPIPPGENTAENPIFVEIIKKCRSICHSDLQFQRVMQALSQASTMHLKFLAATLPGRTFSEHSHMDSTVTPQPDGSIIVRLANGPEDRPFGAHIQITVTAAGEATVTDMGLELRG